MRNNDTRKSQKGKQDNSQIAGAEEVANQQGAPAAIQDRKRSAHIMELLKLNFRNKAMVQLMNQIIKREGNHPARQEIDVGDHVFKDCEGLTKTYKPRYEDSSEAEADGQQSKLEDTNASFYSDQDQSIDQDWSFMNAKGQDSATTQSVISKIFDLYENAADGSWKYNAETYHWQILQEFKEKHLRYNRLKDIEPYTFKSDDEDGYFGHMVEKIQNFFTKKIDDAVSGQRSTMNILSHYEVNSVTGEKFLRLSIREWKTSYDPELKNFMNVKKKGRWMDQQNYLPNDALEYEVHSLKFYKFDEELQQFEFEDEILYDISDQLMDIRAGAFNNDFFLTKNEHTYYFQKNEESHGFQLYRHSFGTSFYKFPVDNNPFPSSDNIIMEEYFIELPKEMNLKDVQISFMKNASSDYSPKNDQISEENNFLENQYVMIKEKCYKNRSDDPEDQKTGSDLIIYKLSDGSKPVYNSMGTENEKKFIEIQCGFFLNIDDGEEDCNGKALFVIKGINRKYQLHYTKIGYERKSERANTFMRYEQHMIMMQNREIDIKRTEEKFQQSFFLSKISSSVNFIYPFHSSREENISSDIKNKQEEVRKHIYVDFLKNNRGKIGYEDNDFVFMANEQFINYVLKDPKAHITFKENDEFISTQDIILKVNITDDQIHYWTLKPNYEMISFRELLIQFEDDDEKMLQRLILKQFNLENQSEQGQNYKFKDTLGYYQNQYLNRVYLTTRQNLYIEHRKGFSKHFIPIEISDDFLLMDLGDKDGQLSILKLYRPDIFGDRTIDLKLEAYYISYKKQIVIFFFTQRNSEKLSQLYSTTSTQSGVQFMVCHTIPDLIKLASNFQKLNQSNVSILTKNTPIFIFGSGVKKIIYTNFEHDIILKYQDNTKVASMMASTLVHEMVHDPNNAYDHVVPFLFSSEKCRHPTPIFQWFFCFLDMERVLAFKQSTVIETNKPQVICLNEICDLFLLREVNDPVMMQGQNEDAKERTNYENMRTRDCPLFCRSAPFSNKPLGLQSQSSKGIDFEDQTDDNADFEECQSTKFMIGFVIDHKGKQIFEITDYLVIFHNEPVFRNLDLHQVFDKNIDAIQSCIKIQPCQMQHVLPSASTYQKFLGQIKYWENFRLIPKIDNDGKVTGTYMMLCMYMIYKDNIMINNDRDAILREKKNLGNHLHIILQNLGKEVLLMRPLQGGKALIYMESGCQYDVPLSILVDQDDQPLSRKLDPNPFFVYEIICTSDTATEPHFQQQTPIMQVGYKNYALDGQPGNIVTILSSRLNKDVIQKQIFDRITQQELMYSQQIKLMTSSIPNLKEIYKTDFQEKAICYFQFRFLLLGRSFCSLDYPAFKNSIGKLITAVDECEILYNKIIEDSAMYNMFDMSTNQLIDENTKIIQEIFNQLQIRPRNSFVANWNFETFVQKSLDNNLNRPLTFLVQHQMNLDNQQHKTVFVQDLPQLIEQDQVDISQFLNEYEPNEMDQSAILGFRKLDGCRLETQISNPDLPLNGENILNSTHVEDFMCQFDLQKEILTYVQKQSAEFEIQRYRDMQQMIAQNKEIPSEERTEIKHFYINFLPVINKIKIDMYMNRKISSLNYTTYLSYFEGMTPDQIDNIDDLFLAELFSYQENNLDFFKQQSVQKIIERQFGYTSKIIRTLLIIYFMGFVVPQIIVIYINAIGKEWYLSNHEIIIQIILEILCGSVQIFFLVLEMGELLHSGLKNYMQDGWNWMDSTQYFFFIASIYFKNHRLHKNSKANDERFYFEFCQIVVVIQSAMKFLQLIRYDENFCFLVEMLMQVSKDIYPFCIVFFTFCLIFSMVTLILEGEYDDEAYPFMSPLTINILQTFRNSIGDLTEPLYGLWIDKNKELENVYQYYVMFVTWFFFIANIFIMQIVLLNFLIAEVSMTYERVKGLGPCLLYQKKQELNVFILKVIKYFGKKDEFKALIMISPLNMQGEEDDFLDLKNYVKDQIQFEMSKLKIDIMPSMKKVQETCGNNNSFVSQTDKRVSKIQEEIAQVKQILQQLVEKQGAGNYSQGN